MPLEERRARHASLMAAVQKYSVDHWADSYIAALADTPTGGALDRAGSGHRAAYPV
jgi:trehalose-6-phosphate synthase